MLMIEKIPVEALKKIKEYDNHHLVMKFHNEDVGLNGFIAIHRAIKKSPSFGATRFWYYQNEHEALVDVLKLSRIMSMKSFLFKLNCGGAKGVIIKKHPNDKMTDNLIEEYARIVNLLNGKFVTGTDMGIKLSDVYKMKQITKFVSGLASAPEKLTALGLFSAINQSLEFMPRLKNKKNLIIVIQGIGKVGSELLKLLYDPKRKIYICDTDKKKIHLIQKRFSSVKVIVPNEIYKFRGDVFCPCAMGGIINKENINLLKYKLIVGAANNQLEEPFLAQLMHTKGIIYLPDFVVNSGGLIGVVNEFKNSDFDFFKVSQHLQTMEKIVRQIIILSNKRNISPLETAMIIAGNENNIDYKTLYGSFSI